MTESIKLDAYLSSKKTDKEVEIAGKKYKVYSPESITLKNIEKIQTQGLADIDKDKITGKMMLDILSVYIPDAPRELMEQLNVKGLTALIDFIGFKDQKKD